MADKRISELEIAEYVGDTDLVPIVHNGQTMAAQGNAFLRSNQPAPNATSLGGYPASDYMRKGDTATNSERLGGFTADSFLKVSEIGSAEVQMQIPFLHWFVPFPYMGNMARMTKAEWEAIGYGLCTENATYSKTKYPLCAKYIGKTTGSGDTFLLPELYKKFIIGGNPASDPYGFTTAGNENHLVKLNPSQLPDHSHVFFGTNQCAEYTDCGWYGCEVTKNPVWGAGFSRTSLTGYDYHTRHTDYKIDNKWGRITDNERVDITPHSVKVLWIVPLYHPSEPAYKTSGVDYYRNYFIE